MLSQMVSEARNLGALESRERFLSDIIKQADATTSSLQRLGTNPSKALDSDEGRVVLTEHRRALREEARHNSRIRKSSFEEVRMIRKEIVESKSIIGTIREKLESRLR